MADRRKEFDDRLRALLKEFGVELTADDHYRGYPECGQTIKIIAEFEDWKIDDIDYGGFIDSEIKKLDI